MTLGIIGTAGRGSDATKLTPAHWRMMCCIGQTVATTLGAKKVVSGGAAWGDSVATWLFTQGLVDDLTLHLPAPWVGRAFAETDCGNTANRYHHRAQACHGHDGLGDLAEAINVRSITMTCKTASKGMAPFFGRNTKIAQEADALLAFTFGSKEPTSGGTRDTWDKFMVKLVGGVGRHPQSAAFHFSLSEHRLFALRPPFDA